MKIYLIGSLKNPNVSKLGNELRKNGFACFDDWMAAGPDADDEWQKYERARGRTYQEALRGEFASHVFDFDNKHLRESDVGVLVLPAGKSGHLELGVLVGLGRRTYILLNGEPERYEAMYNYATAVVASIDELLEELKRK